MEGDKRNIHHTVYSKNVQYVLTFYLKAKDLLKKHVFIPEAEGAELCTELWMCTSMLRNGQHVLFMHNTTFPQCNSGKKYTPQTE